MQDHGTSTTGLSRLLARQEAERRQLAERFQAKARRRILEAAQVDPDTLSDHGRRILDWLTDLDDPTVDGLVELLATARMGVYVEAHKAEIARETAALRESEPRLDAMLARPKDGGRGVEL